ncbi:MAG: MFS transporter [Flavobacteriaceae bacterium]|nr:MFS transporter [Flavobacteriaceae bacterium]|tara:strand:+ start:2900 stop:4639 length:1740 start_codon:yes stop_codon:yes gene_type:complete
MDAQFGGSALNQRTIFGHPVGLFILFFTEMWERFSYYGMRALLVLFLTAPFSEGGFNWTRGHALELMALYTGLVYVTPIIGGYLADKLMGSRLAVLAGGLLMTLGHGSLAFETPVSFYIGLLLLILGNGFFKPNISSIVGDMYLQKEALKDSAYTIFYMGINAGAFLGILLCGWYGINEGWSYGFGLAGVFMLFGTIQFYSGQKILGDLAAKPSKKHVHIDNDSPKKIPFTQLDTILFASASVAGILLMSNNIAEVVFGVTLIYGNIYQLSFYVAVIGYLVLIIKRLLKYERIERDRLIVVSVLTFASIFFWVAFEQASGTMTIFARDYTNRVLEAGFQANAFRIVDGLFLFVPLILLSGLLYLLGMRVFKSTPITIIATSISFAVIWYVSIYKTKIDISSEVLEIPASWFSSLNSFFIIVFAPIFSLIWAKLSKFGKNPSGPMKFALGLFVLGLGYVALAYGSYDILPGAKTASVSILWLILAYLFHTLGELCLSPVGLSYISKLSPKRLVGFMFGIWFFASAIGNFMSHKLGSYIDEISTETSMSSFFMIFFVAPTVMALILVILNKPLTRMMHGMQ